MKRILSIYKRELRTFFNSPIAYIVLCVLLIGIGYFFFQTFFVSGQANLRTFFRFAAWSFVLFGPAVTMKLFAEEKKTGTIEPLLTLPIHEWEIVAGKFLAAWTLLGIYLLLTLSYPISVSFVGDLDGGPVIGGYIGLLFLGATFVSLGLFASAITRNQVVSLIVAFVVGLVLFVLDLLLPFVPAGLQSLVEFVGVDHHFQNISRGVVDTRDVIYTFSLTALFLFATAQALHTRLSDHSAKWRLNRWLYIGGAVGCFISVNALSSQAYARADLTEDRIYTLTDGTRSILGDLRDQLRVTAYFSRNLPAPFNAHERVLRDKLEEYRNASNGKLTFEFVDPDATGAGGEPDPAVIAKVNAAQIPKVEVNKFEKDQIQVVKVYMGVALAYQDKQETLPLVREVDDLEYQLTSRIAQLVRTKTPRLGFLTGHGEKTPSAGLANVAQLLGDKYESAEINLAQGEAALT
ncbi:Gldg family protein, partial [bacterium]|nr:Gldg family protein [bacterium]